MSEARLTAEQVRAIRADFDLYGMTTEECHSLCDEVERLRKERDSAKAGIAAACLNNHKRNVELDALHYVWCDGGCKGGTHRFGEHPPLTSEIVDAAIRNTDRLVRWLANRESRDGYTPRTFVPRREFEAAACRAEAAEAEVKRLRDVIENAVALLGADSRQTSVVRRAACELESAIWSGQENAQPEAPPDAAQSHSDSETVRLDRAHYKKLRDEMRRLRSALERIAADCESCNPNYHGQHAQSIALEALATTPPEMQIATPGIVDIAATQKAYLDQEERN